MKKKFDDVEKRFCKLCENIPIIDYTCLSCKISACKLCSRCKSCFFCSSECQKKVFKNHKLLCDKIVNFREEILSASQSTTKSETKFEFFRNYVDPQFVPTLQKINPRLRVYMEHKEYRKKFRELSINVLKKFGIEHVLGFVYRKLEELSEISFGFNVKIIDFDVLMFLPQICSLKEFYERIKIFNKEKKFKKLTVCSCCVKDETSLNEIEKSVKRHSVKDLFKILKDKTCIELIALKETEKMFDEIEKDHQIGIQKLLEKIEVLEKQNEIYRERNKKQNEILLERIKVLEEVKEEKEKRKNLQKQKVREAVLSYENQMKILFESFQKTSNLFTESITQILDD